MQTLAPITTELDWLLRIVVAAFLWRINRL